MCHVVLIVGRDQKSLLQDCARVCHQLDVYIPFTIYPYRRISSMYNDGLS